MRYKRVDKGPQAKTFALILSLSPLLLSSKLSPPNFGDLLFKEKLLEFRKACSFQ